MILMEDKPKSIANEDIDRLAIEIESDRQELLCIGATLRLTHTDVVQLSQNLDVKIVTIMKMEVQLKKQQKQKSLA
ncbi:MAG: Spo0E like sporulation regulatory protein [Paenibacillus sp.]|jgi:hypothetical protein|nr:Spo0E like sporulation regulatory protein [Paenibacillus sp.]